MPTRPSLGPKTLILSNTARADLRQILFDLGEKAGPVVAERFLIDLDTELQHLAGIGHSGASRESVSRGLRIHIYGNYCCYFRLTVDETLVVRILHGARDITKIPFEDND